MNLFMLCESRGSTFWSYRINGCSLDYQSGASRTAMRSPKLIRFVTGPGMLAFDEQLAVSLEDCAHDDYQGLQKNRRR